MRFGAVGQIAVVAILSSACGSPPRPVDPMQVKREQAAVALAAMLEDENDFARALAMESLQQILAQLATEPPADPQGPAPQTVVDPGPGDPPVSGAPDLAKLLEDVADEDTVVRVAAIEAIGAMGEVAAGTVPVLMQLLEGDQYEVAEAAAIALGRIGGSAYPAYEKILALTGVEQCCIGYSALDALPKIGPPPQTAVKDLLVLVAGDDDQLSRAAVSALAAGAQSSVPFFEAMLERDDPRIRELGYTGLAEIGPAASEAIPQMLAYIREQDGFDLLRAFDGFGAVYAPTMPYFDVYFSMAFWGSEKGLSGHLALFFLIREASKEISEPGYPVVPDELLEKLETNLSYFIEMLSCGHNEIRVLSSLILGFVGPSAIDAFDALMSNLTDPDPDVRAFSAAALGLILGKRSPSIFPTVPAS